MARILLKHSRSYPIVNRDSRKLEMLRFIQSVSAVLGLVAAAQLQAVVLFDASSDPNVAQGGVVISPLSSANDFEVTKDSILTDARFWTLEGTGSNWDETLVYTIWSDQGGVPATTPLTGGVVDCTTPSNCRRSTGRTFNIPGDPSNPFTQYLYEFDLLAPFELASYTRYWLGLYLGDTSSNILWQYTSDSFGQRPWANVAATPVNWQLQFGQEVAFQLNGVRVPLPATALLMLVGLVGLRHVCGLSKAAA